MPDAVDPTGATPADGHRSRVLVIMGSVRAGRRCPDIAAWVLGRLRRQDGIDPEIVDLRDWPLPGDTEPRIPAEAAYATDETRAWSAMVAGADGFVIVTPQYNWGYPAPLKNALDHVYVEWRGKPLAVVTYGGHGGTKCATALALVADALKLRTVEPTPALTLPDAVIHGGPFDPETLFAASAGEVDAACAALAAALSAPGDPAAPAGQ